MASGHSSKRDENGGGEGSGPNEEDLGLYSSLTLSEDLIEEVAELLKDEARAIRERKMKKHEKLLQDGKSPETIKVAKNIVTSLHTVILKAIKELRTLDNNLVNDLQRRFNLQDDWMGGHSGLSSRSSSDVCAPTLSQAMRAQRLDLLFNNAESPDENITTAEEKDANVPEPLENVTEQIILSSPNGAVGSDHPLGSGNETDDTTVIAGPSSSSTPKGSTTPAAAVVPAESTSKKTQEENSAPPFSPPCYPVKWNRLSAADADDDSGAESDASGKTCVISRSQRTASLSLSTPARSDRVDLSLIKRECGAEADPESNTVAKKLSSKKSDLPSCSSSSQKLKLTPPSAKETERVLDVRENQNVELDNGVSNQGTISTPPNAEAPLLYADDMDVDQVRPAGGESAEDMQIEEPVSALSTPSTVTLLNYDSDGSKTVFLPLSSKNKKDPGLSSQDGVRGKSQSQSKDVLAAAVTTSSQIRSSQGQLDLPPLAGSSSDKENQGSVPAASASGVQSSPSSMKDAQKSSSLETKKPREAVKARKKREGMVQAERCAMLDVLGSSSDSDFDTLSFQPRTKKLKLSLSSRHKKTPFESDDESTSYATAIIPPETWKNDPKLKAGVAKVFLHRLDDHILEQLGNQRYVELEGFSNMLKKCARGDSIEDEDTEEIDSADSLEDLRKAVRKLTKSSIFTTAQYTKKRKAQKLKTRKARSASSRKANRLDFEFVSSDEDESERPVDPIIKPTGVNLFSDDDVNIISASGSEDLDEGHDPVISSKKAKAKQATKESDPTKKKKSYIQVRLSSSDSDSAKRDKRDILSSSDGDSDFKSDSKKKPRSSSRKKITSGSGTSGGEDKKKKKPARKDATIIDLSDSDTDFEPPDHKSQKKRNEKPKSSGDSGESIITINTDDSDFLSDKGRSSRRKGDSDRKPKSKKKKRKRIVLLDSDESVKNSKPSDVEIEEIIPEPGADVLDTSMSQGGRKNIRKIMSSRELARSTREAEKDEEQRKKRVSEKQNLYNGTKFKIPEGQETIERLVLDFDLKSKRPIVEVDPTIVNKLKPHQVNGIRFMYDACFESVNMIKKNKEAGGCILAHCMGLGKTLQSVALLHTLLTNDICGIKSALIICPLSTVSNWYREFKFWTKNTATSVPIHKLHEAKATFDSRIEYLRKWQVHGGVGIIHYDMFVRLVDPKGRSKMKDTHRAKIEEYLLQGPDIVICDEGHLLKNWQSQRSEAVNELVTRRRIVLTGTPLQNNLVEYYTMMNFVKPNLLGSLPEFTNRFVNPIKNGQHADSTDADVKMMKRRAHVLHRKLEGCVNRCDFTILTPYLPPKFEYIINIKLSEKQETLYKFYLDTIVAPTPEYFKRRRILMYYAELVKVWSHPLALTMRKDKDSNVEGDGTDTEGSLKDFIVDDDASNDADGPGTSKTSKSKKSKAKAQTEDDVSGSYGKWWTSVFATKEEMQDMSISTKLIILQDILRTCESIGDKVLVFSQFLTSLDIVEQFLAEWDKEAQKRELATDSESLIALDRKGHGGRWRKNIEYFRIDGGVKQIDRQRDCDTFNRKSTLSKAKLFLISTRAGGLGINLFGANRVVIFDASWNPSSDMQSIFRVYRFGQDKPCYIYRLISKGTMEQKILRRQITKLSLSSRVVDEHQIQRHFKFDDVNELFEYDGDEEESGSSSSMAVPQDKLLADLILSHSSLIRSYEVFDSLLENRPDEHLSKEEKDLAWAEYKVESDRAKQGQSHGVTSKFETETYLKVHQALQKAYPTADPEQIDDASSLAVSVVAKTREFSLLQNTLPEDKRHEMNKYIDPLKNWLQQSMNPGPREVPPPDQPLLQNLPKEFNANPSMTDFCPPPPRPPPPMPMRIPMPDARYGQQWQNPMPPPQNVENVQRSMGNMGNLLQGSTNASYQAQLAERARLLKGAIPEWRGVNGNGSGGTTSNNNNNNPPA